MNLAQRLADVHRRQDGYSLVISMLLLSIMMVLLSVSLQAGTSSLNESHLSIEWSKALTIAEAGANQASTLLGQSRSATNPCRLGTSTVCSGGGGEYQMTWATSGGKILVTSRGYYPSKADPTFVREVQETYEPVPSFKYAIFSQTSLAVNNGMTVSGDIYSAGDITIGQNAEVCGSIISSAGGVTFNNSSQVVKEDSDLSCTGKSANVWTGGTGGINGSSTVTIEGSATAANPSSATCSSVGASYAITGSGSGMTIAGAATACGAISNSITAASKSAGTSSTQPTPVTFPAFTFDPNNYSSDSSDPLHLQCYPSTAPICGENDATDAVSSFQTYVTGHKTSLTGTFAVWQRSPSQSTVINLDGIKLSGDFTLMTNAPVDFGNTSKVSTTSSSVTADLVIVSTYQPTGSCTAALVNTNNADCSIFGQNAIQFDAGDLTNPDDGVVGLLYTTGKMAFVNSSNNIASTGEGALYAQAMDFKNGYDILYNSRVERVLGFGTTLEQTLWQEINV
jgi:uncharacterized Zn-binding protein involved in type VI secretion